MDINSPKPSISYFSHPTAFFSHKLRPETGAHECFKNYDSRIFIAVQALGPPLLWETVALPSRRVAPACTLILVALCSFTARAKTLGTEAIECAGAINLADGINPFETWGHLSLLSHLRLAELTFGNNYIQGVADNCLSLLMASLQPIQVCNAVDSVRDRFNSCLLNNGRHFMQIVRDHITISGFLTI